jgi:crotonobetainyl-CoA:carnitine CoA-transferase CaiB-like acyl-CoA transferase
MCGDGRYMCALPLYMNDRRFGNLISWLRGASDIFHEAQKRGLAWSPINSPDELVNDEDLNERDFYADIARYSGPRLRANPVSWRRLRRSRVCLQ